MRVWNGDEAVEGVVYGWNGTEAVPALNAGAVPYGSRSVSAMLAEPTFYWGHRGSSAIYPEMSMYAYTQAVLHGVHALEVSFARTSDGVWFGLHDETINKTSPSAPPNSDARNMTWAQVQQYQIVPPSGFTDQPSRPYMRMEEIVEAYGGSHVLVVDPKVQVVNGGEFLDRLLALGMPRTRLIAKFAGNGRVFADIARARGIVSWGYYYEKSWDVNKQYAGAWDLLGLDHGASQATWDDVKSFGKPVVAHIVATRSAADSALVKGADGLQISGVRNVLGVPVLGG